MSFFNSLSEYVTNSVAGLSLSPKRFSISRSDTSESGGGGGGGSGGATNSSRSNSAGDSVSMPGFPKVVPLPSATSSIQRRRSTFGETLLPPTCPASSSPSTSAPQSPLAFRHPGSLRMRSPTNTKNATSIERNTEGSSFCCRRASWPEIDHQIQSGVQDIDGSFFEGFTALAWKLENQRQAILQNVEALTSEPPVADEVERKVDITPIDYTLTPHEKEKLYVEMLYTIANTVGAPAPGGQYAHFKEDLYLYGQRAFDMPSDRHYGMLHVACEEQPPIVVLNVVVLEAEGLEAKDANGFSDPYCMLGIQPMAPASSPQPFTTNRTLTDACSPCGMMPGSIADMNHHGSSNEKLRKHHSFKLSFKRKDGGRMGHRDSLGGGSSAGGSSGSSGALPAKYIRATSVKSHTLHPKWNEKFRFDIDDINSDSLHLDIWDHDDESSVLEAVSKLNEIKGVRGLGRFFKQICQSARQSSQDDFLGCVTIPLQDIPSTGMEGWFKLEARSQRSSVQGKIKLKMWLSTRENRKMVNDDNWSELIKHESLYVIFVDYELRNWNKATWAWSGDLPGPALTILHQHAVQGNLTELQTTLARFIAASRIYLKTPLDPRFMLQLLTDIENIWLTNNFVLTREEEMYLADKFTSMQERWLQELRHHRQLFPALHPSSLVRLEYLLRCLAYMSNMKSFWKCCPFNKEIRGEIVSTLRKGTPEWFSSIRSVYIFNPNEYNDAFVDFATEIYVQLNHGLNHYHPLFEGINGIPYFSVIYKQIDKLMADEVINFLNQYGHPDMVAENSQLIFSVYMKIKDLAIFHQNLPMGGDHKLLLVRCHELFESAVSDWLNVCKGKALQRVRRANELQKPCLDTKFVKHNSSAVDVVSMFCHLRDFWRLLQWPKGQSIRLLSELLDCICSAALLYADIIYQKLFDTGYFDRIVYGSGPIINDDMCITVNNMEYVYKFVSLLENYFDFVTLESYTTEIQFSTVTNQLDSTLSQFQIRIKDILKRIGPQMQETLRKAMFHVAWSPDTMATQQAIDPLFDYLYAQLKAFNMNLLPQNFHILLADIWEYTLAELNYQITTATNENLPVTFHERLHSALEMMAQFFHANGNGLSMDRLHSMTYYQIEQRLHYHQTDTEKLIELFYEQRLNDQFNQANMSKYGSLTIRPYFKHDSLCIEVLHAHNIIPLDPNGFSDPFVIIELLPKRVFPHCNEQQTNVHKKTLNPIFDECFEFSVTLEQCRSPGAMVAFTVMDHDVLTANDFAGEAFLPLNNVSGVADNCASIDYCFHGLKPIELTLMQQYNKNHPILQILESRINDRLAIEFVKKQKQRFAII